ncbi:hypothetical protein [Alishewanella sp. SMS8]|uniref:hypothetical protein n=1 Tax=Alishewanella sp. SMS8 TaxID=2994676 RepID=UPI0027407D05|nr:hypothetical protein [Alishewanella sp. SMS8]MDP5460800.1 hypothetical protein [Alishewanella sp. SMS8]
MNNQPIGPEDIPRLTRLQTLCKTMNAIDHLAQLRNEKVVYAGRIWRYADLVYLAYEYYVLAIPYGLKIDNFSKWLAAEQAILKQFNLPWPVGSANTTSEES